MEEPRSQEEQELVGKGWEGSAQADGVACQWLLLSRTTVRPLGWSPKSRGAGWELPTLEGQAGDRPCRAFVLWGDLGLDPNSSRSPLMGFKAQEGREPDD